MNLYLSYAAVLPPEPWISACPHSRFRWIGILFYPPASLTRCWGVWGQAYNLSQLNYTAVDSLYFLQDFWGQLAALDFLQVDQRKSGQSELIMQLHSTHVNFLFAQFENYLCISFHNQNYAPLCDSLWNKTPVETRWSFWLQRDKNEKLDRYECFYKVHFVSFGKYKLNLMNLRILRSYSQLKTVNNNSAHLWSVCCRSGSNRTNTAEIIVTNTTRWNHFCKLGQASQAI